MPEVEERAGPRLPLVEGDDLRLDLAGSADGVSKGGGIAPAQAVDVFLEPFEEANVANRPVLDHLGEARGELAVGKGIEGRGVGNDRERLVEGADHVLAERVVHAGLATHR